MSLSAFFPPRDRLNSYFVTSVEDLHNQRLIALGELSPAARPQVDPPTEHWFATAATGSVWPQQFRAAYRGLLTGCGELGIGLPRSDFIAGPYDHRPGGEAFKFKIAGDVAGITFRENGEPRVGFVIGQSPRDLFICGVHEARHVWQVHHEPELFGTPEGEEDAARFERDFRCRHSLAIQGFDA